MNKELYNQQNYILDMRANEWHLHLNKNQKSKE